MTGEVIAAIVAAGVSAGAAGIAIWQARIAHRAAGHARTQADAAKDQVALMQRQLDAEDAARHEAAGPQFEVLSALIDTDGEHEGRVTVKLRQVSGSALTSVLSSARFNADPADIPTSAAPGPEDDDDPSGGQVAQPLSVFDLGPMAAGSAEREFFVYLPCGTLKATVFLSLECRDDSGDTPRVWHRTLSATARPAPRSRLRWFT